MRFQTLAEWLAWQEQLHPAEIELGLERVAAVYQRLQPAKRPPKVITVGGTNGKGSSVALLTAIYQAAGYRVGCYTSPHLLRYTERICINGVEVEEQILCAAFDRVDQARGATSLTYFEFGTLAALDIFNRTDLDVVILEVGMGGRLDAVNIIDPDVALITNVALDHQDWLGEDREQIAFEKAGILRGQRPAVFGEADMPQRLAGVVEEKAVDLRCFGRDFGYERSGGQWRWWSAARQREALPLPALRGEFQLQNAAAVLMVLELMQERLPVSQQSIREGLLQVKVAGRFQVFPGQVQQIVDVAHNPHAAATLARNLRDTECLGRTLAVMGMMRDKDIAEVIRLMAEEIDAWFVGGLALPRAATGAELRAAFDQAGIDAAVVQVYPEITQAYRQALEQARPADRLVIFGSFYVVAAVLPVLVTNVAKLPEVSGWNTIQSNSD
ncbi:MAG: bifunctional tetrahydrofolate synthase/dihydrofolate synthase [Pseudomonadota bacterium]